MAQASQSIGLGDATAKPEGHLAGNVEHQIRRALDLWEQCCSSTQEEKTIPLDVRDHVRATLGAGMVPPIYHALVMRNLFPANTHPQLMSSNPVEVGTKAPTQANKPMLGFKQEDLSTVLLSADGMHAHEEIRDGEFCWRFVERKTEAAAALLNTNATMIGEDVEVTKDLLTVPLSFGNGRALNLITRRLSRGVVASCLDSALPRSQLAITGTTGTGKTWTLLYALQQAMLYDNACVVLLQQNQIDAHLYLRKNNRIFAWCLHVGQDAQSRLFRHDDVLVLLGPECVNDHRTCSTPPSGGATYYNGNCRLIYTSYNHDGYFRNDILQTQSMPERFLSPWTEEELRLALPYMQKQIVVADAIERAKDIGMLPHCPWEKGKPCTNHWKESRDGMVSRLFSTTWPEPEVLERFLMWDGMDSHGYHDGGRLIAVHAKYVKANVLSGGAAIGYDGQGVVYTERRLESLNEAVTASVANGNRKRIVELWKLWLGRGKRLKGRAVEVVLEQLLWSDDLQRFATCKNGFTMARCHINSNGEPIKRSDLASLAPWTIVPERLDIKSLRSIFESDDKICRMKQGTDVIGFAGPGRRVYRLRVEAQGSVKAEDLVEILIQGGYLQRERNGMAVPNWSQAPPQKLEFIWVVPKGIEAIEVGKVELDDGINAASLYDEIMRTWIDTYLDQYVLWMDPDLATDDSDDD